MDADSDRSFTSTLGVGQGLSSQAQHSHMLGVWRAGAWKCIGLLGLGYEISVAASGRLSTVIIVLAIVVQALAIVGIVCSVYCILKTRRNWSIEGPESYPDPESNLGMAVTDVLSESLVLADIHPCVASIPTRASYAAGVYILIVIGIVDYRVICGAGGLLVLVILWQTRFEIVSMTRSAAARAGRLWGDIMSKFCALFPPWLLEIHWLQFMEALTSALGTILRRRNVSTRSVGTSLSHQERVPL